MNIIRFELKNLRFQFVLWTGILLLVTTFYLSIYNVFYSNKESFLEIINNFPPEALQAFRINKDTIFSPLGYYSFLFSYLSIIAAFQAGILGLKIMNGDYQENAVSFLFTKPISRKRILSYKLIAGLIVLIGTNILFQLSSLCLMEIIKGTETINLYHLFLINTGLFFIQITFMSITMMIGGFIKNTSAVNISAIVSIVVFYIISIVEDTINNPILRYINPFSYFKVSDILESGGYKSGFIIASIFLTFFCFNFAYIHYDTMDVIRRD